MTGRRNSVQLSIVTPTGYASSTCGYCSAPGSGTRSTCKTSKSYGIWAHRLSPYHYQSLIDQGWRRSGAYLYKPDLLRTCCAQIPIRLVAHAYKPSKGHRRALTNLLFQTRQTKSKPAKWKGRWSRGRDWNLESRWNEVVQVGQSSTTFASVSSSSSAWAEHVAGPVTRKLSVSLALASSSDEKYQLFRKYQAKVHGEAEDDISSEKGFSRFLVETSLALTWPSTGEPLTPTQEAQWRAKSFDAARLPQELPYGCFHQEYRLDGKLIAVGVLDILPKCTSSVYVFYDPEYNDLQLGKVSALQEITLTRRLSRLEAMQGIAYYYMGFYIHTCQKMKYKAEYRPSQLLDCSDNSWNSFVGAAPKLDAEQYFGWSDGQQRAQLRAEAEKRAQDTTEDATEGAVRVPTRPIPPPGMLDAKLILQALEHKLHGVDNGELETAVALLQEAKILEAQNQSGGIKPLLVSREAVAQRNVGEDGQSCRPS